MSELTPQSISHLARLARLDITPEEQDRYASQLSSVVEYIEQLSAVDTSAITELRGVTGLVNVLAADQVREETDLCNVSTADLLAGAPVSEDSFYVVRAVLGDEAGAA